MKAVRHFGIVVGNMEKSIHFYRDILGLRIYRDMQEEGKFIDTILGLVNVKVRTVKMTSENGNTLIELLDYQSHRREKKEKHEIFDIGASHVAFEVKDIEQEYKRLKEQGIVFTAEPQISLDGKAKVTFCFDPDGVPIELVEEISS